MSQQRPFRLLYAIYGSDILIRFWNVQLSAENSPHKLQTPVLPRVPHHNSKEAARRWNWHTGVKQITDYNWNPINEAPARDALWGTPPAMPHEAFWGTYPRGTRQGWEKFKFEIQKHAN